RGHDPGLALGPSGRGGQGRGPDPPVAQPAPAQARDRLVPLVRTGPGRRVLARRARHGRARGPRGPAARRGHGLRRQRPRRGARGGPRCRLGQRQGPDLRQGRGHQDGPRGADRRSAPRGGDAHRLRDGGRRGCRAGRHGVLAGVPARLDELGRNGPSDPPAGHGQVGQNPSMGRWRAPLLSGRSTGGRALTDADVPAALRVCAQVPVDSVLAASRIATAAEVGLRRAGGTLWGFERDDELVAVCWSGANLVPVVPPGAEDAIPAFARLARGAARRSSSIVGERESVLELWGLLAPHWPAPREVRADQPSLAIDTDPLVSPDPLVRRTRPEEYDDLLPACLAMFTEEVGYSPASGPSGPYEMRVRHLVAQGRSYARF